jgi:hypothetical protein
MKVVTLVPVVVICVINSALASWTVTPTSVPDDHYCLPGPCVDTFQIPGSLAANNDFISFHINMPSGLGHYSLRVDAICQEDPSIDIRLGDGGSDYIISSDTSDLAEDKLLRLHDILTHFVPSCTDFQVQFHGDSNAIGQQCVSSISFRESPCSKISTSQVNETKNTMAFSL